MPLRDDHSYVIAEFGSNHMGSREHALRAIETAKDAGTDACKFQLFRLPDILIDPSQGDPRTCLPPDWIPQLHDTCREFRIDFLCTPFSAWAVEILNPYVEMWKIGSFEHARADIWEACQGTGKPIIASKGRCNCGRSQDVGNLYCISKYPTMSDEIHLPEFGGEHSIYNGFSDHTTSTVIPALAVARGARIIEKHFRLEDTPTDSPDYPHSLTPGQLAEMVTNIRLAELTCWRQPPADTALEVFSNRRE